MPSLTLKSKGTTMPKIPPDRARSHLDFSSTPLGYWARHRDDAILTPGGRHVQRRTGLSASLANSYAAINGLGEAR
jgi:hypothetical protein